MAARRVLLVEDDGALLELLTEYLELQGLDVVAVDSGEGQGTTVVAVLPRYDVADFLV